MCTTITDAYAHFEDLHGGEHPIRSLDELREVIHACGLRYEEITQAFWDAVFDSGWAYDVDRDDSVAVTAYRAGKS